MSAAEWAVIYMGNGVVIEETGFETHVQAAKWMIGLHDQRGWDVTICGNMS